MEVAIDIQLRDDKYKVVVFRQFKRCASSCDGELYDQIVNEVSKLIYPHDNKELKKV